MGKVEYILELTKDKPSVDTTSSLSLSLSHFVSLLAYASVYVEKERAYDKTHSRMRRHFS